MHTGMYGSSLLERDWPVRLPTVRTPGRSRAARDRVRQFGAANAAVAVPPFNGGWDGAGTTSCPRRSSRKSGQRPSSGRPASDAPSDASPSPSRCCSRSCRLRPFPFGQSQQRSPALPDGVYISCTSIDIQGTSGGKGQCRRHQSEEAPCGSWGGHPGGQSWGPGAAPGTQCAGRRAGFFARIARTRPRPLRDRRRRTPAPHPPRSGFPVVRREFR